jgi:hypothetical protein
MRIVSVIDYAPEKDFAVSHSLRGSLLILKRGNKINHPGVIKNATLTIKKLVT